MGEKQTKPFQLSFNGLLKVDFQFRALIVSMSFQPVIPWRVAPQQSPPPLPRPVIVSEKRLALETFFQRTATCPHLRCLTTGVQPSHQSVTFL